MAWNLLSDPSRWQFIQSKPGDNGDVCCCHGPIEDMEVVIKDKWLSKNVEKNWWLNLPFTQNKHSISFSKNGSLRAANKSIMFL